MSTAIPLGIVVALAVLLMQPRHWLPRADAVASSDRTSSEEAVLRRLRAPLVVLAVFGGWSVLGGWSGAGAGAVAGMVAWRVLSRVESPATAQRRAVLEGELPIAVHLLGSALAAGASPASAVLDVAEAVPGPVADEFRGVHHRLLLGVDPATVWRSLDGPLQPLGRTMVRAHESGASVRSSVEQLAADLIADARLKVEARARSVEVKASAPLGVCFLPAFVILGVVPMVVGIFSTLRLYG